jgi:hypothetical protein
MGDEFKRCFKLILPDLQATPSRFRALERVANGINGLRAPGMLLDKLKPHKSITIS